MSTKHVFESPQGLVLKSLRGAVALNPSLRLDASSKTVYIVPSTSVSTDTKPKLTLISGGGAGHEPAHAGYTGRGMLTASVSGDIFASPSAKQVVSAIMLGLFGRNGKGDEREEREALVIINNYTGDRLNFGLAIEKARSLVPNLTIHSVIVSDDVSLLRSTSPSLIGARGLGGNVLVCKILGALAERGAGVQVTKQVGKAIVARMGSIGVGLEHCHVPGRDKSKGRTGEEDEAVLAEGECEIGMGLHNEPGARKVKIDGVESLIREMLGTILTSRDAAEGLEAETERFMRFGGKHAESDDVVLFINNLGGMSQLEMGGIVDEVLNQLEEKNVAPLRVYSASYMTSLNAPGFSISLLNVSGIHRDLGQFEREGSDITSVNEINILQLLDDPTEATAWTGVGTGWGVNSRLELKDSASRNGLWRDRKNEERQNELLVDSLNYLLSSVAIDSESDAGAGGDWYRKADISPEIVRLGIEEACAEVLRVEGEMTRFDTVVGDGDCGETFAAGSRAILSSFKEGRLDVAKLDPATLTRKMGEILEDNMGGTIGALFALYFTALSTSLSSPTSSWMTAPESALSALSTYTPARPGDRTVIDALQPFCSALASGKSLADAVKAAKDGAEGTKGMKARLGRAVYVGGAEDGDDSVLPPDPGAWGVAAIVKGLMIGFAGKK